VGNSIFSLGIGHWECFIALILLGCEIPDFLKDAAGGSWVRPLAYPTDRRHLRVRLIVHRRGAATSVFICGSLCLCVPHAYREML
jgi:hypothetical protein